MAITKKRKAAEAKLDKNKVYTLAEAASVVKTVNLTKFDSSVDVHIRLGVDPKKADQAIRGTVTLPHGTGKTKRVLVLCTPDKEAEAKAAGADFVGLDEYVQKIDGGWTDVDVIVATPSVMPKIGRLGKILGRSSEHTRPDQRSRLLLLLLQLLCQEYKERVRALFYLYREAV